MVSRETLIRNLLNKIMNVHKIWEQALKISPLSLEDLLESGLKARLPVSAAKFYAPFYRYLEIVFDYLLESGVGDKRLRDLYKQFKEFKRYFLEDIIEKSISNNYNFQIFSKHIEEKARALRSLNYHAIKITFMTNNRTLVGVPPLPFRVLFEAGTAMHPTYEVPYIPGTALKGLLRSYIELRGLKCRVGNLTYDADLLMGSPSGKGMIIITDALPVEVSNPWRTLLEPEVTTPIYADGTHAPRIEEHRARPNPIIYPAIARHVVFSFVIGLNRTISEQCRNVLSSWLREAFLMGIGRKTSLSYGISSLIDIYELDEKG